MRNYTKFEGKLIIMNKEYPIYNRDDDKEDEIIGYTSVGDMAVITFAEIKNKRSYKKLMQLTDEIEIDIPVYTGIEEGYFETVIVSGKYAGIESLAFDIDDIAASTFIFNKLDGEMDTYIQEIKIKFEYI